MAVAPEGSDDEEGEAEGRAKWVPGRVLSERTHKGTKQYKISLDGYDSEDDAWVDCDDGRVHPYEAASPASGGGDAAAAKEEAKREAAERDASRRFNEQRKGEARSKYAAAGGRR